ncbi:hypothetical protein ACFE04_010398 [Oxalis oulophora]
MMMMMMMDDDYLMMSDYVSDDGGREFKLIKKTQLSHNSAKFRFALPTPTSVFGLPPGQHVFCRGRDYDGRDVVRPYTPITLDSDLGYFELVVKMYPKGKMSHYLREIVEGDTLAVKGPKGLSYDPGLSADKFMVGWKYNSSSYQECQLRMLVAGSKEVGLLQQYAENMGLGMALAGGVHALVMLARFYKVKYKELQSIRFEIMFFGTTEPGRSLIVACSFLGEFKSHKPSPSIFSKSIVIRVK